MSLLSSVLPLQGRLGPATGVTPPELLEALINVGQAISQAMARWVCAGLCRALLYRRKRSAENTQVDAATVVRAMNPLRQAKARPRNRERGTEPRRWRRWPRRRRVLRGGLRCDVRHAGRRSQCRHRREFRDKESVGAVRCGWLAFFCCGRICCCRRITEARTKPQIRADARSLARDSGLGVSSLLWA